MVFAKYFQLEGFRSDFCKNLGRQELRKKLGVTYVLNFFYSLRTRFDL